MKFKKTQKQQIPHPFRANVRKCTRRCVQKKKNLRCENIFFPTTNQQVKQIAPNVLILMTVLGML